MPLFGYICTQCGEEQELLVRQGETPVCEHCGSEALEKQMSHILPMKHSAKQPASAGCGSSQCCQLGGNCQLG